MATKSGKADELRLTTESQNSAEMDVSRTQNHPTAEEQDNIPGASARKDQSLTDPGSKSPVKSAQQKPELSQEVVDLIMELRDTVKRLDPKKHTPSSLRRALANVSDILSDIDKLAPQKRQGV